MFNTVFAMAQLLSMLSALHRHTMEYLANRPDDVHSLIPRWRDLRKRTEELEDQGEMSSGTAEAIYRCAVNTLAMGRAIRRLGDDRGQMCDQLSQSLISVCTGELTQLESKLKLTNLGAQEKSLSDAGNDLADRPPSYARASDGSDERPAGRAANDHLRLWFLEHLAFPYPTPNEKDDLSSLTGFARTKIDSDLTNWRRRAGWTEIKDTYARGSRKDMQTLMERVELGTERNKAVLDAVEKMRAYLERREEEKVGDWVKEVSDEVVKGPASVATTTIVITSQPFQPLLHRPRELLGCRRRPLTPVQITIIAQPAKRAGGSDGTSRITSDSSLPEYDDFQSSLSGQSSIGSLSAVSSVVGPRTRSRPSQSSARSISSSSNWSFSSETGRVFSFWPSDRVASGVSDISMALVPSQSSHHSSKRSIPSDMDLDEPEHPSIRIKSESSGSSPSEPQWYTPPSGSPSEYVSTASPYFQPGPVPMGMSHNVPMYAPPVHTTPISPHMVDASAQHHIPMDSPTSIHNESQGSIWSTATPLPVLPHMMNGGGNGFQMPSSWEFQPQFAWGR